jgi:hypothetical protein
MHKPKHCGISGRKEDKTFCAHIQENVCTGERSILAEVLYDAAEVRRYEEVFHSSIDLGAFFSKHGIFIDKECLDIL